MELDYTNTQRVFQIISILLSYPDQQWREGLVESLEIIDEVPHPQIRKNIRKFIDFVQSVDENELIESYVDTFDFGKKTNLYVTYLSTGEQRERGIELLDLKQAYKAAGFEISTQELPDYLPLMLEFASQAEQSYVLPIIQNYYSNIFEIWKQLVAVKSYYAVLIDALLMTFEEIGIRNMGEGSL
jgi:nitrate reductase molybdenum cofactor assembly chaperone NarJ/NarW